MEPAKMAIPPKVGMLLSCFFLSHGSSYKCFNSAILTMAGIEKKQMTKLVMNVNMTWYKGSILTHNDIKYLL